MKNISFNPIFFESMGAKSSATLVSTPDINILIDPGIAALQPSFPAPSKKKNYWEELGTKKIRQAAKKANIIVISHYHYDHFMPDELEIYKDKFLFVKNPNEYINDSQRKRAENFFEKLCESFGNKRLNEIVKRKKEKKKYPDPLSSLPFTKSKNFGDYQKRKNELLEEGEKWFALRVKHWQSWQSGFEIPELNFKNLKVKFPEGKEFKFGKTKLKFTQPLFHGIEFARVGWVFSTIIKYGKEKLIHSSDLDGPVIEDYAEWLIRENPRVLILDGPATYLVPYMVNLINLKRAIDNVCRIIRKSNCELIIYDHHLLRDVKYREMTKKVWEVAKKYGKRVLTAAEWFGKKPIADEYKNNVNKYKGKN